MKIVIESVKTKILIGGVDHLANPKLIDHLREYMSVKVPGSFFAAKKLRYHWDGMKYFLTPGGSMATGFLPIFLRFIEEEYPDLEVEIIDSREELPQFRSTFVDKVGSLTITQEYIHQKMLIEAYNNYIKFRDQSIYFPRGVIDAATNSGKTAVIAGTFLNLLGDQRMIVIIHRVTIYRELLEFFKQVFGEVGQINDKYYTIRPVTLCMIQTLYSRIEDPNTKKDLSQFTVLAVDECHRAGSAMYTKTLVHCHAGMRIFVSGSAFESDDIVSKMIIVGLSGSKLATVTKKEMMSKGISTPVKVKIHLCNTILRSAPLDYRDCIKQLIHESSERATIIYKIVKERMPIGPILIAVDKTEHGKFINEQLQQRGIRAELTHSKDPAIIRRVDAFRTGDLDVLISTGVLREGVNLPLIQTIIMAAGEQSRVYIKQWCGRGERISEGKTETELHDFYDIGKYVQAHSLHRIKLYKAEELELEMDFDMKNARRLTSVIIK